MTEKYRKTPFHHTIMIQLPPFMKAEMEEIKRQDKARKVKARHYKKYGISKNQTELF